MAKERFTVDLNKPLVFQVFHLGEAYDAWVHRPIIGKESPRFFHSSFLEFLTKTVWWVVPLVWLPVVCWFVSLSFQMGISPSLVAGTVGVGVLLWTLMEYFLPRFLFHIQTKGYWANTIHYLVHGCHHKHPMDSLRLVFPPAGTAIILFLLWNLLKQLVSAPFAPALTGGILLGYVMYDCTHYYLHHGKEHSGVSHNLKRYHMHHHFKVQEKGFGITSNFWDKVFGTLPPKAVEKNR